MLVAWITIICFGVVFAGPTELNDDEAPKPVDDTDLLESSEEVRVHRATAQNWLQLLAGYKGDAPEEDSKQGRQSAKKQGTTYPLQAIPFELPVGDSRGSISLVLLPVPVPQPASDSAKGSECQLHSRDNEKEKENEDPEDDDENYIPKAQRKRPKIPTRRPVIKIRPLKPQTVNEQDYDDLQSKPLVPPQPASKKRPNQSKKPFPSYVRVEQLDETPVNPLFGVPDSSKKLLEKFLEQAPVAPELPPALLSEHDNSERIPQPDDREYAERFFNNPATPVAAPAKLPESAPIRNSGSSRNGFGANSRTRERDPPKPRFDRSLILHGELTVPRADYTEPYTTWWDASSGAARVDFHGGSTSTFRTMLADGNVQRLEMRVDRSGAGEVRRCGRTSPARVTAIDRAFPALPDMELFNFAGYEQNEVGRVERWRHTVTGAAGELGGARGEALTFRHDMLLVRDADITRPLRYTVAVDSSALGENCDVYEHKYLDVREQSQGSEFFTPNMDLLCDNIEVLNPSVPDHMARLEPLREFTIPGRDLRYDEIFQRFKIEYNRQYVDNTEEAMRKNLLMQHVRFIQSGNREGGTFELGVNFLGDRLDVEVQELLGVELSAENIRAEQFPHSRSSLKSQEPRLPNSFDWRPRGAVSPVRYQGSCSSCWAFAVAGSVEGALFIRTQRLTPLSEKCLVDCAHPFGGKGCKGTWPSNAFDYVQNRGLPALDEYPAYKDKVDQCAEDTVRPVTRISAHVNVTANSVTALKVAIRRHAPTVVIIDAKAKSFVFYKKGVLYDDRCAKAPKKLNHAVLAVGWGQRKGEPHFILKNSWSDAWGERGYVRLQARANTCGVLAKPSYPRLEDADVLRGARREKSRVRPRETDEYDDDFEELN